MLLIFCYCNILTMYRCVDLMSVTMSDCDMELPSEPSQSSVELCTPPHQQTLEQVLIETPASDLEALLEKVLEKRPELRERFSSQPPNKSAKRAEATEELQVTWDPEYTGLYSIFSSLLLGSLIWPLFVILGFDDELTVSSQGQVTTQHEFSLYYMMLSYCH